MPRKGYRVQPGVLTLGISPLRRRALQGRQKNGDTIQYSTLVTTADLTPLQGEPFSLNVPGVETPG
jgi:hypothetical protein